jgi:hypothetical protein
MNRRELATPAGVAAGASVAWNSLLAPIKAIAADVKPVRITPTRLITPAWTSVRRWDLNREVLDGLAPASLRLAVRPLGSK